MKPGLVMRPAGSGGVLVNRHVQLARLAAAFSEAKAARPSVVLVSGPAGVGKTALLRGFLASLGDDALILHADGDERETELPFGTLQQLLVGTSGALLDRLTGVVAGASPTPDPLTVGVELLSVIGSREGDAPIVMVVDDASLADRPSLDALTFALRRLRADHVLTVLALRSGGEGALPPGLLRLVDGSSDHWLDLEGLAPAELRALSVSAGTGDLTPRSARRLHEYTAGNPLYALALLREVGTDALLGHDPPPAPPSLSMLLLSRMAGCAEPTVRLLQAAAVLGRRAPLDVAARLAGVDEPLAAFEEAAVAGLLVAEGSEAPRLAFAHPLIHAAVYTDLGAARRASLHARAAELLTGDAALDHRVRAALPGDVGLAEELRARAAEEAARARWPLAARHLVAAARLHPTSEVRSVCLLRAAALMLASSEYEAVLALEDEIGALESSPLRDYVLGHLKVALGGLSEATSLLEAALLAADPDREPELAAVIAFILAECHLLSAGPGVETANLGRLALRLAPPGSPARLAWVAVLIGTAVAGRPHEALRLAPPVEDMEPNLERFGATFGRGAVRLFLDDLDGARRDLAAVEEPLVHRAPGPLTGPVLFHRADVELRAGAWDDALAFAHLGASIAADTDDLLATGFHATVLATVHALRGQWASAEAHLAVATSHAQRSEARAHRVYTSVAAARLAFARGDRDGVLAACAPLIELADEDGLREHGIVPWRDLYADALIRTGRLDEAEDFVAGLEHHAVERRLPSARVAAYQLRGSIEAARGHAIEARTSFEAGLEAAEASGLPFAEGMMAMEFGAFLRRAGNRRDAARHLARAAALFRRLGAEPFLQRCEQELRATGRRRARRGTSHLALTPQEYAVARLVGQGLSNREVASRLVISVKTVEYHLSNLYGKLGLRSRTELAARMAQGGGRIAGDLQSG